VRKTYSTVDDAMAFARFAYHGLEDKAGLDYLAHPVRVMQTVKRRGGVPYIQVAALLHDVIEDTVISGHMLTLLGFHRDAVEVIELLTRGPHEGECSVTDLCAGCIMYYHKIKEHPGARMVKIADMEDNMDETRLSYLPPKTQERLRAKYAHGMELLLDS
jgi:(p)ppGpp synthase/HD superfamily hydrolase